MACTRSTLPLVNCTTSNLAAVTAYEYDNQALNPMQPAVQAAASSLSSSWLPCDGRLHTGKSQLWIADATSELLVTVLDGAATKTLPYSMQYARESAAGVWQPALVAPPTTALLCHTAVDCDAEVCMVEGSGLSSSQLLHVRGWLWGISNCACQHMGRTATRRRSFV